MPELPEVEVARRNLRRWARGRRIEGVEVRDARVLAGATPAEFRERLVGRVIGEVERRGKQLLVLLDDGGALASHLGMTGKWLRVEGGEAEPRHTRLALDLQHGRRLCYRDPRLFGRLRVGTAAALRRELFGGLGPDPLEPGWSGERLAARLARTRRPVKAALLDQARVAGVGNIQASEALWRAGIHPGRPANALSSDEYDRLAAAIRESIEDTIAVEQAEVIEYIEEPGAANPFRIFRREGEPCPRCGRPIRRIELAGRGTYLCARCQPERP